MSRVDVFRGGQRAEHIVPFLQLGVCHRERLENALEASLGNLDTDHPSGQCVLGTAERLDE